jgi:hypothetical protein
MSRLAAILVALPLAAAGGALAWTGTARVGALREEVARLDAEGRAQGAAFVATLSRERVEEELATLDRRKAAAAALAAARRNRLVGAVLLAASVVVWAGVRTAQRVASELEEDRRGLAHAKGDGGA